jgi:hypothetical protein
MFKPLYAAAAASFALAACVSRESASTASTSPPLLTFTAHEFSFEGPDTVAAGVTEIRLVSAGAQLHHAALVRFTEDGKGLAEFLATLQAGGPPPTWAVFVGGPNPPSPGGEASVVQDLDPGRYAVICLVDVPDKVPHIMKGMSKEFVVVGPKGNAAEPTASVTMHLVDYAFQLSAPLAAGTNVIRVENAASQPHEVFLAKLLPGKTVADFMKWGADFQGPPPVEPMGGVAPIATGEHAYFTAKLEPGEYLLVCFLPDAKDGKLHLEHGMIQAFRVS